MGEIYDNLCEECNAIDLNSAFSSLTAIKDERGIHLADISERLKSPGDCALCHLFASVQVYPDFPLGHELRAFSFFQSYGEVQAAQWNSQEEKAELDSVVLSVVPTLDNMTEEDSSNTLKRCSERGFIAKIESPSNDPRMFCGRVVQDEVDIDEVKGWVDYCSKNHTQTCRGLDKAATLLLGIQVIDCYSGKVVPLNDKLRFAALSYVVGKSPKPSVDATATGFERYPILIRDAMALTTYLGVDFLWVDQFCINQLDEAERKAQIQSMNFIYSAADFTIIAAAGDDPYTGIPGVGDIARKPQPCARTSSGMLASTLPHPTREIQLLKWSTRGWTYQEGILSTRRIVLTPHQAYFECNGMHAYESFHLPIDFLHTLNKQQYTTFMRAGVFTGMPQDSSGMTGTRLQLLSDGRLQQFWRFVEAYTARDLTYESDALDAFAGILRSFVLFEHRPIADFWGLPIYSKSRDTEYRQLMLGFSLGWRLKDDESRAITRREDFPSWSWMGWRGTLLAKPMDYLHDNTMLDSLMGVDFRIRLKQLDGLWVYLDEIEILDDWDMNYQFVPLLELVEAPTLLLHRLLPGSDDARMSSFQQNSSIVNFNTELQTEIGVVNLKCLIDVRPSSLSWSGIIEQLRSEKWLCIIVADTYWATLCILVESIDDECWSRVGFFEVARERRDGRLRQHIQQSNLHGRPRTVCLR